MKRIERVLLLLLIAALLVTGIGCGAQEQEEGAEETMDTGSTAVMAEPEVAIDDTIIPVTWEDNEAAAALLEAVTEAPEGTLIIDMERYGGFEQVGSIGQDLPAEDRQITTGPGDIVLYQGNQMVIFYGSNQWSYTRLGSVDLDPSELTDLLGDHDVTLTIRVAE